MPITISVGPWDVSFHSDGCGFPKARLQVIAELLKNVDGG